MSAPLVIWIPVPPKSPNNRPSTTRGRMALVKAERERGYVCAVAARNSPGGRSFSGPATIDIELCLRRLRDPLTNLGSLKATVDGICRAVLPLGDGPETPYRWLQPRQTKVRTKAEEGVRVTITEI